MSNITLKASFQSDVRRVSVPISSTYEQIRQTLGALFELPQTFSVKYQDEDGDFITITSNLELTEAINLSKNKVPSVLRIYVEINANTPVIPMADSFNLTGVVMPSNSFLIEKVNQKVDEEKKRLEEEIKLNEERAKLKKEQARREEEERIRLVEIKKIEALKRFKEEEDRKLELEMQRKRAEEAEAIRREEEKQRQEEMRLAEEHREMEKLAQIERDLELEMKRKREEEEALRREEEKQRQAEEERHREEMRLAEERNEIERQKRIFEEKMLEEERVLQKKLEEEEEMLRQAEEERVHIEALKLEEEKQRKQREDKRLEDEKLQREMEAREKALREAKEKEQKEKEEREHLRIKAERQSKSHDIKCSNCGNQPIIGARYKCANCDSYDICEACEENSVHRNDHVFLKIYEPWKQNFKFVLPNFYQYQEPSAHPSIPTVLPFGYQTGNEPSKTYAEVLVAKPAPKQLFTGAPYKFAAQLTAIQEIFPDSSVDYIKSLLEKHKGNSDLVMNDMIV